MDNIKAFFKIIGGFLLAGICGIFYLFAKREVLIRNDNRRNLDRARKKLDREEIRNRRERDALAVESGEIDSERADIDREGESINRERGILDRDAELIAELKSRSKE